MSGLGEPNVKFGDLITKWHQTSVWTPEDVIKFLETLTEEQANAAKVIHFEVKILIIYPQAV